MRKVIKARSLGFDLQESEIRLLYFVWAKCDLTSYCCLLDSGTCFSKTDYLTVAINLYANGLLEIDNSNAANYRLSQLGRDLIMELGM